MNNILLPSIIIALAIVVAALTRLFYHVKPKAGFAQVSVGGNTSNDGEAFQGTITLFPDETPGIWQEKLVKLYELKEWRLKYQNERMLALEEAHKQAFEAEKAALIAAAKG